MSGNIDKPPYPLLSRVRVRDYCGDYTGKIVYAPRWTAIGWEARVLRDGPGQKARWVQADCVSEISAVDRLAALGG